MKILFPGQAVHACKINYCRVIFICLFFCAACAKNDSNTNHPVYINTILKRMDTGQNKYTDWHFAFIDSFFNTLQHPGIEDIYITDSIKQSKYSFVKKDYLKAILLLDTMMVLIKEKTNEQKYADRYAMLLYFKSDYLLHLKKYAEASRYILLAEKAAARIKNKCNLASYNEARGYLMYAQEKYPEAAFSFLKQYREYLPSCDTNNIMHPLVLAKILNNVALCYFKAGTTDSASWYQYLALHTVSGLEEKHPALKTHAQIARAVIYGNQAELFVLKGRFQEAEELYKKSIAGTKSDDPGFTQSSRVGLADLYLTLNKPQAANEVLGQLKASLDILPGEHILMAWQKLIVKYCAQTNQFAEGLKYSQQYEALRDSIDKRDKQFKSEDFGKELENIELKYANRILQKESELKNSYLIIGILIFAAIAVTAIIVWYNLNRTRKLTLEVKNKNEDMQKALSSLEQSHHENKRLVRMVAHDLKNPISAVNNLTYSLLKKNYPEDLQEIFRHIKAACVSSIAVINDVLTERKKSASDKKELVDIKTLLEYCVQLLQAKANEKNQQLLLQADSAVLLLNRQEIWQLVTHIVNNAIQFSPENAVIELKLQRQKDSVLLSVHDKAATVSDNVRNEILKMPGDNSGRGIDTEDLYGTDLYASKKIAEEHQGKIWLGSIDGKGNVFYIQLPIAN